VSAFVRRSDFRGRPLKVVRSDLSVSQPVIMWSTMVQQVSTLGLTNSNLPKVLGLMRHGITLILQKTTVCHRLRSYETWDNINFAKKPLFATKLQEFDWEIILFIYFRVSREIIRQLRSLHFTPGRLSEVNSSQLFALASGPLSSIELTLIYLCLYLLSN